MSEILHQLSVDIIQTISTALLILDSELRVMAANEAFYRTFQASSVDIEQSYLYELGSRQWDIPQLRTLLERVIPEDAQVEKFEVAAKFPTIGDRIMALNARRIKSPDRQAFVILLTFEDVTARSQAEKTLQDHVARYRSVFQTAHEVLLLMDRDGNIV